MKKLLVTGLAQQPISGSACIASGSPAVLFVVPDGQIFSLTDSLAPTQGTDIHTKDTSGQVLKRIYVSPANHSFQTPVALRMPQ